MVLISSKFKKKGNSAYSNAGLRLSPKRDGAKERKYINNFLEKISNSIGPLDQIKQNLAIRILVYKDVDHVFCNIIHVFF